MKKQIIKFWKYYIKGEYHCDTCPCGWSEYSVGCEDWDAGCVIKGEIADNACRLIPPFRTFIGWIMTRRRDYYLAHEYDDYQAYSEKEKREIGELKKSIKVHLLEGANLYYWNCLSSEFKPLDEEQMEDLMWDAWEVRHEYENMAHPIIFKSLRLEWRELLVKTIRRITCNGIF